MEQAHPKQVSRRAKASLNKVLANHRAKLKKDQANPAKVRVKAKVNRVRLPTAKGRLRMASPHPTANRAKAARKVRGLADKATHPATPLPIQTPPTSRAKPDSGANLNEAARNPVPANHKVAIKVAKAEEQAAATKGRSRAKNFRNGTNACAMSSRW